MNSEQLEVKIARRINIGMMAASFAIILGLLQVVVLDKYLIIALIWCSAVIPLSLYFGLGVELTEWYHADKKSIRILWICTIIVILCGSYGFSSLLLHFSFTAMIVFFATSTLAAMIFTLGYLTKPKSEEKTLEPELKQGSKEVAGSKKEAHIPETKG